MSYVCAVKLKTMSTKIILYFFKYSTYFLYYCFAIWLFGAVIHEVYKVYKNDLKEYTEIEHINFKRIYTNSIELKKDSVYNFSNDKVIKYQKTESLYSLKVKTFSKIGFYYSIYWLTTLCFITWILWIFKTIFNDINLSSPFKYSIVKKLKLLAFALILYNLKEIANHFILYYLLNQSHINLKILELDGFGGGDILTGLIIFIIAIIYQRGVEIYEENTLTV